jgi:hypothetical protein
VDKKALGKLMEKPMNRREFLALTGTAVLGVLGATTIVRGLRGVVGNENGQGYGAGAYGGGGGSRIH